MAGTTRRRALWVVVPALVLAAVAASAVGVALWRRPSPAAPGPILDAELELSRLLHSPRALVIRVSNRGSEPVRVTQIELVTDSFVPTGPISKDVVIDAGRVKGLEVIYGEAVCGGETAPPLAPMLAKLVVVVGDQTHTVELPLPDHSGMTFRFHNDCAAQTVAAAADIRLEGWSIAANGELLATLVVERRAGDEPLTLHMMRGSVLYRLIPPQEEPIDVLPSGQARLEVPIRVNAARCDGHAMADVKFPYRFPITLSVGDSPALASTIATDQAGQQELVRMWHRLCGI
jgi:hypothetical protein